MYLDLKLELNPFSLAFAQGDAEDLLRLVPRYRGYDERDKRTLLPVMEPQENKVLIAAGRCEKAVLGETQVPGLEPFNFMALCMLTDLGWYPVYIGIHDTTALCFAREALGFPVFLAGPRVLELIEHQGGERRPWPCAAENSIPSSPEPNEHFSAGLDRTITLSLEHHAQGEPPADLLGHAPVLVILRQILGPDRITLAGNELPRFRFNLAWKKAGRAQSAKILFDSKLASSLPVFKVGSISEAWIGEARLSLSPAHEVYQLDRRHAHIPGFPFPYKEMIISALTDALKNKFSAAYQDRAFKNMVQSWTGTRSRRAAFCFWGYEGAIEPVVIIFKPDSFEVIKEGKLEGADIVLSGYLPAIMEILEGKSLLLRLLGHEVQCRPRHGLMRLLRILR